MTYDYHYTREDDFGPDCPENWQEIAAFLNRMIDEELEKAGETPEYGALSADGLAITESIWERFCMDEIPDCPKPVYPDA